MKKLTGMNFDITFDRPIEREKHYISPGGYILNGKQFDFCRFIGEIADDTLKCRVDDFDDEYAEENGVKAITPADIIGEFSEFYIYTGEYDDEPINPVKISNLMFDFGGEMFYCPPLTLESANRAIFS